MHSEPQPKPAGPGQYLRGILWMSGGNIVNILAGTVIVFFASRLISKDELGAYFLVLMFNSFGLVAGNLGYRTSTVKFLATGSLPEKELTANVWLILNFAFLAAVCLVTAVSMPLLSSLWPSPAFRSVAWSVVPMVALGMFYASTSGVLAGFQRYELLSMVTGLVVVVRMVLTIIFLFMGFGLAGIIWGVLISFLLVDVFIWLKLPMRFRFLYKHQKALELLRFSKWMYGYGIVSMANYQAGSALLGKYASMSDVAVYNNAMRFPNLLLRLFESIKPVVIGYVAAEAPDPRATVTTSTRILAGFLACVAGLSMALAKPIVLLLFSERYVDCLPILRMLSFWIVLALVNDYITLTLIGMGRVQAVFLKELATLGIIVAGHFLLIPLYGGMGVAISLSISALLTGIPAAVLLLGRDLKAVFFLAGNVARSAVPLFALAVMLQLCSASALLQGLCCAAFALSLSLLKAITLKDLRLLVQHVRQR